MPDAMTLAKGLGGGVPIGALVDLRARRQHLLTPGQHGSTFGGNPLACAAGLAVLDTIAAEGLLDHAREPASTSQQRIGDLGHPLVTGVRGRGLLRAITLAGDHVRRRRRPGPRRRVHRQPGRARRASGSPRRSCVTADAARRVRRRPARAARRRHRRRRHARTPDDRATSCATTT